MRINKYIQLSGIASRRKADELVKNGNVKVNGKVMDSVGYDVKDGDTVSVNGEEIKFEKKCYYLLNKPYGVVTTLSDEKGRMTVIDLMDDVNERVFPVGRLDYNTTGALIMTNDGDLSYHITHPKNEIFKTYLALVNGVFSEEKANRLRKGIKLETYTTHPAKVKIVKAEKGNTLVEVSISEGKNHEVRDMLKAVGNPVMELKRVSIGKVNLGHLLIGHYRKLTKEEIEYLKNA